MDSLNLEQLSSFLVKAKIATARLIEHQVPDVNSSMPWHPQAKQAEFTLGDFYYRDVYFGLKQSMGQEVVYYQNEPIWSMCYVGFIFNKNKSEHDLYALQQFLSRALQTIPANQPFRGDYHYFAENYEYINKCKGDIQQFIGEELIFLDKSIEYQLNYSGGLVC